VTGIRAVDGLLPLGRGQRIGLFSGSGVGKSTLLAQLARGTESDVAVVALVGERGREVAEFLEDVLTEDARARTTIVVATSDAPPLLRMRAAEMATSLAEFWRAEGRHCLLLVDSLTRYARALREVALLSGELPARRGYPASVFAALPRLLERAGTGPTGAITAVYTVLVDGGDMEEPVADEVRGIVDGHWVLRRDLAERGRFPALDIPGSVSRVAPRIVGVKELEASVEVRCALALLNQHGDAIDLGIYEQGSRAELDSAIECEADLIAFCCQAPDEFSPLQDTVASLLDLADQVQT
jgi:FliI/YscN family ATPase